MNRLDRALGILLWLRNGKPCSAAELAKRFAVSPRTIYRDIETLSAVGVPIYAEMGREGGFRLLDGYFLPPLMFSVNEAISLLLGLTALDYLRAKPFAAEIESAEQKLLAAVPDHLRAVLAKVQTLIGFESTPADVFHPESAHGLGDTAENLAKNGSSENEVVSRFVQALLEQKQVTAHYRSPYRAAAEKFSITPYGLFWDRDRWYLVGKRVEAAATRFWRADRVLAIQIQTRSAESSPAFDIHDWLDRRWLAAAMTQWIEESPVVLRITRAQAERLRQDWYYRHARYEEIAGGQVRMTFGEDNVATVLALVRWLGPGAELVSPQAWRAELRAELMQMLSVYADRPAVNGQG